MKWIPRSERALTAKEDIDRGSGALTRKTKDIKKSIGDGQPCPGMMDHNGHSLLRRHCLTLSDIISFQPIWADLTVSGGKKTECSRCGAFLASHLGLDKNLDFNYDF